MQECGQLLKVEKVKVTNFPLKLFERVTASPFNNFLFSTVR